MASEAPLGDRALVLLSGGQDSTTCLHWALRRFATVRSLGFDYGQSHRIELEQATKIAEMAGVPFHVLDLKGLLGDSALTDPERPMEGAHHLEASLPASFVFSLGFNGGGSITLDGMATGAIDSLQDVIDSGASVVVLSVRFLKAGQIRPPVALAVRETDDPHEASTFVVHKGDVA